MTEHRADSEYVKEAVIEGALEKNEVVSSGSWLAIPGHGRNTVDVYKYEETVKENDN